MTVPEAPLTILILDDNTIDREACRRHLSRNAVREYHFIEHNEIDGAIDVVKKIRPDCILLDYHLHDGNGVEFLGMLAEIGGPREYPVVMLTGTGSEAIAVQVMKAGAQDYLVKDRLNSELLQRTVETAIYKAQTERLLDSQRLEMERLFRDAHEANARKDQFLAALSHELRTPLTPVLAAITATDVKTSSPDQLADVFGMIRRNIELEARLIDDMLDLTRISRGKLEVSLRSLDVHSVIEHAVHACEEERAAKDITLDWQLNAANPFIKGDAARLQQIIWNLLKNALKFTPKNGTVTIRTENTPDGLAIEIADTGIGLAPGMAEKIFDAFEQGNSEITRRFGGLGLGLAISKALVEAHGGEIRAENNHDGAAGARFIISLPDSGPHHPAAEKAPVKEREDAPQNGRKLTVLLIEDHADSAYFLKMMLENIGYHVLLATDLKSALEIFKAEAVDLIVSDLGLPDGRSTDLMKSIARIRPTPAIALSGYGMESDVLDSLESGFALHLTKPIDFEKLADALKSLEASVSKNGQA